LMRRIAAAFEAGCRVVTSFDQGHGIARVREKACVLAASCQSSVPHQSGADDPGRFIMRKLAYACVAIILLAEPALALPVIPMPVAPVLSGGQIAYAAYGHWHRVARRTVRRHHRDYY
jgi:hypothetical protein